MTTTAYRPTKVFTVEEANAMLPLVRAITSDLVRLAREVIERRQRLALLMSGRDREGGDPYSDELAETERGLERDSTRLKEYLNELLSLGVEPKSAPEGLIDFPSIIDNRLVYLCWKYDESEVMHWHELDAGFAGRQPLTFESCPQHFGSDLPG